MTARTKAQESANLGRNKAKEKRANEDLNSAANTANGAEPTPVKTTPQNDNTTEVSENTSQNKETDSNNTTKVSENTSPDKETTEVSAFDSLTHLQTPDQIKQNEEKKNKEDNTAEITPTKDLDEINEEDDNKFDIQQGDFIDFLMKDVVLAFAAYCGKKVTTPLGIAFYQASSKLYHGAKDNLWDPAWAEVGEAWNKFKNNVVEACRCVGEYEIKHEFKNDDETSKFGNDTIKKHNDTIKYYNQNVFGNNDSKMPDSSVFDNFAKAIMNGKVSLTLPVKNGNVYLCEDIAKGQQQPRSDLYWFDTENKVNVPIGSAAMQRVIYAAIRYRNQINEQIKDPKEQQKYIKKCIKSLSEAAKSMASVEAPEHIFVRNMITARQLHDRALTNENPDKDKLDLYAAEAQKIYLAEYLKILKGQSQYKNLQDFINASYKAVETAHKNIREGRYVENGVDPQTIKNEPLDRLLQQNAEKIRTTDAKTLRQEVMDTITIDNKNKKAIDAVDDLVNHFTEEKKVNNEEREKVEKCKKNIKNPKTNGDDNKAKDPIKAKPTPSHGNSR